MENIKLKYGKSEVEISLEGAKSVKTLLENPMEEIKDIKKEFRYCVGRGNRHKAVEGACCRQ